jgi:hypothetical protein
MNAFHHAMRGAALILASVIASPALSAEIKLPSEGWTSWEVPAVEGAPSWCCYGSWRERDAPQVACQLDGGRQSIGTRHDDAPTDAVKVYARVTGGKVDSVQVFAASCPVEAKTQIHQLGLVSADDSARWLIDRARHDGSDAVTHRPFGESALAALAMNRGDLARDALSDFARNDARYETRKSAVFWLAVLRGTEGADITSSVMFADKNAEFRKHAAFALAQSKSPRVAPDLIRLGNTDEDGDVRGHAWFCLALTGAGDAERAIGAALRKDADDHARTQAIFALSQLPDERATRALIAAAEDQSLSREQRKHAVFWLSQSKTDSAQAYLEKVLARIAKD